MGDTGLPGNIPLADDNTPFTPIQTPFNAIATALNIALGKTAYWRYTTKAILDNNPGTDVGQHATVYADTTAAYNRDYWWTGTAWAPLPQAPFAIAAGTVTLGAGVQPGANATASINFPSGRFTQPPFVFAIAGNARFTPGVSGITKDVASLSFANWSGGAGVPGACYWVAIQMLAAGSAG